MFDAGFSELLLIFVIALLILGPERLPRVAAQLGRWIAKARRTANQLRWQLEREVALDEIYRAQPKRRPPGTSAAPGSAPGTPAEGTDTSTSAGSAGAAPLETPATETGAAGGSEEPRAEESRAPTAAAEARARESQTFPAGDGGSGDPRPDGGPETAPDAAAAVGPADRTTGTG